MNTLLFFLSEMRGMIREWGNERLSSTQWRYKKNDALKTDAKKRKGKELKSLAQVSGRIGCPSPINPTLSFSSHLFSQVSFQWDQKSPSGSWDRKLNTAPLVRVPVHSLFLRVSAPVVLVKIVEDVVQDQIVAVFVLGLTIDSDE